MATFKRVEDIEAWQKARQLARRVYAVSARGSFAGDSGLRDQARRAANSVMANIAEGFERGGSKEFVQFLAVAKGSAGELRSHLYAAFDQDYLSSEEHGELDGESIARMIGGLMGYLKRSEIAGPKYKDRP